MFDTILVPLDRSSISEQALGRATAIARASEASVHLVVVHEPPLLDGFVSEDWTERQWNEEESYLKRMAGELQSGSGVAATYELVRTGPPIDVICERARATNASLIVMTSHGRTGWNRLWMGSVADGVVRRSSIPVLILAPAVGERRAIATKTLNRILVPLDGSDAAHEILPTVTELARCERAAVTLLRVVRPVPLITLDMTAGYSYGFPPLTIDERATQGVVENVKRELEHQAAAASEATGQLVDVDVIVDPNVAQTICRVAAQQEVGLIAMCTRGRGASRLLVGSVADKVIRGSGRPMLVYRPTEVAAKTGEPQAAGSLVHA